ncbi:polysaccharide deacetylase family protein [Pseudoruegeria sp. SK021]|uniref:polysaccharide deacetylase family protein n=1 Tax=Pseudoruegeria sp. SK021 TaxID=1933035 RepID=UPI000A21B4FD|nr:polysaccharide deacetylase family protein [Pseudoruegeria sp. SK021]OSP54707.1 polysaccharide deacetylase [Pseudoruegeria sp. SK021]
MLTRQTRYAYSPITRRPKFSWPGNKRLAVYVVMGVEEYNFGPGMTEDIFPGAPKPDYVNTSWRDYGNRVGGFRLIDRCKALGVQLSILLNTDVYDSAPDLTDHARAAGCEIVGHGLSNSDTLVGMDRAAEADYLEAVAARIEGAEGDRPGGWSSPWLAQTEATVDLLKQTGYRYLLDLRLDDQPVWLTTETGPLLALPYALELNDSTTIIGRQTTADAFSKMIIDEFDELRLAAEDTPLVMSIVVHSFISGQPFRLAALTRALRHITAGHPDVWLTTPGDIAAHIEADPARAV